MYCTYISKRSTAQQSSPPQPSYQTIQPSIHEVSPPYVKVRKVPSPLHFSTLPSPPFLFISLSHFLPHSFLSLLPLLSSSPPSPFILSFSPIIHFVFQNLNFLNFPQFFISSFQPSPLSLMFSCSTTTHPCYTSMLHFTCHMLHVTCYM